MTLATWLQAQQSAPVAAWQTFPYGTLLTIATLLAGLMLAALVNRLRGIFQTRDSANEMGESLRRDSAALEDRVSDLEDTCKEANRTADEAFRMAQLTDRAQAEQWSRVSEELIGPVREMARDLRETREMVVKYIGEQSSQAKDIERLERRLDQQEQKR